MKAGATRGESCGAGGESARSLRSGPRVVTAQRGWPGSVSMMQRSGVLLESKRVRISGILRRATPEMEKPAEVAPRAVSSGRIHRNDDPHDEHKRLDGAASLSGRSSGDSPCRGQRRGVDVRTGTASGDRGRFGTGW